MSSPPTSDPFSSFELLMDAFVQVGDGTHGPVDAKIDALERLIEDWRIARHKLSNPLKMEEFEDWQWRTDCGKLLFTPRSSREAKGTGTPPIKLQRKLLVFLLLHHSRYGRVMQIIDGFIAKIRPDLTRLDFKKTATGVFRCYTNTRFAANKLREFGLLKFTRREAYKTWVLSLPGFLVAAKALGEPNWHLPDVEGDSWHGLDPFVLDSRTTVQDFASFVGTLKGICAPNAEVFKTFDRVLRVAYDLLGKYWAALQRKDMKVSNRAKLSRELIEQLDFTLGYGDFLEELSTCIQVEDLLRRADRAAGGV